VLQQAREADPHLERVHPALARGVTVAAVRDGDIGRCYRGCIGREVERTVAVVVPGREGLRERGLGVGGSSSVVVGGHFGGAERELAVLVCGRLQGKVVWGRSFVPGRGDFTLGE
jgi:hypothetical protein